MAAVDEAQIPKNHVVNDPDNLGGKILKRQGKPDLQISEGLFVSLPTHPDGVKIIKFIGDNGTGPIGFTYLPYRHSEDRWATPQISLRGDPRFIICSQGLSHFGLHTDLETLELVNGGIPPPEISLH